MQNNIDKPIANIDIYRLDIYRLLVMLLADKEIVKDETFKTLGNEFSEGEVNRLLILIAVISRQLLEGEYSAEKTGVSKQSIKELANKECGKYWVYDKKKQN